MSKQQEQHDCNNNKNNQPNRAPSAETWLCVMKPYKASSRSTNQRDFEKTCFLLPLPLSLSFSFPRVIDRDSRTNSCVRVCVCTQLSSGGIFIYPLPLSFSLSRLLENINLLLLSVIERREGERKKRAKKLPTKMAAVAEKGFFFVFLSFFLVCGNRFQVTFLSLLLLLLGCALRSQLTLPKVSFVSLLLLLLLALGEIVHRRTCYWYPCFIMELGVKTVCTRSRKTNVFNSLYF